MKAFIVFGQTREYSDHTSWPVKGFLDKDRAEQFEFELTKIAKKHHDACEKAYKDWRAKDKYVVYGTPAYELHHKQFPDVKYEGPDTKYNRDYTGTDYYTIEVDIDG